MPKFVLLHLSDLHVSNRPQRVGIGDLFTEGVYIDERERPGLWQRVKESLSNLSQNVGEMRASADARIGILASHNEDTLLRLARFIHNGRESFDAVLISGDLATSGSQSDLVRAYTVLTADPDAEDRWRAKGYASRATLSDVFAPPGEAGIRELWVVPGNHDRYNTRRFYAPGGDAYKSVFTRRGPGWTGDGLGRLKFPVGDERVKHLGTLRKGRAALCCVAADFSLQSFFASEGVFGYLGQGKADAGLLGQLETLTRGVHAAETARGRDAVVILWLVHFPPEFPYEEDYPPEKKKALSLLEESAFLARAGQLISEGVGVEVIFAGHTHRAQSYPAAGGRPIIVCAGSATQHVALGSGQNQIYLVEIDTERLDAERVKATSIVFDRAESKWAVEPAPEP